MDSAVKASSFVSEELAFERPAGIAAQFTFTKISVAAGAQLVNRSRDDLLPVPVSPGDQDGVLLAAPRPPG